MILLNVSIDAVERFLKITQSSPEGATKFVMCSFLRSNQIDKITLWQGEANGTEYTYRNDGK